MKKKVLLLVFTFLLWTLAFILQKPIFLIAYGGLSSILPVIWHGLPLDLSMAGYLSAIPGLILLINSIPLKVFHGKRVSGTFLWLVRIWFVLASLIVALAFVANIALYGYWKFPLDSTPIFFFFSSPSATMASIEWWQGLLGVVAILFVAILIGMTFQALWIGYGNGVFAEKPSKIQWIPLLLLEALLFLPIRGGVTVSTMNTGKAYFSQDQTLNHAAVNPLFSFMESMTHQEDFAKMYRFMDDKKAHQLASQILPNTQYAKNKSLGLDHIQVLKDSTGNTYPDIYIVIMESFSDTLTHVSNVTPQLNRLKQEGVYFKNFYANGFRTDRGLVSILLGYPSPGALSLMKYPRKTAKLSSLTSSLNSHSYYSQYYYGGDADFTNMRSFLINQGFKKITSDVDFPVSSRLSKWGVPDHLLFQRVEKDLSSTTKHDKPVFTVIQTSSSHEPFDVPYHRLKDKVLNAFAYTDSCVGGFVDYLKKTPRWNNSLVIFIPDHLGAWPNDIDNFASWRFHVPMIWVGGAIKEPVVIDTYGSQQDIAATVLGQLGVVNHSLQFSKDLFDPNVCHYAYFMMNDGFGVEKDKNEVIYDNKQRKVVVSKGKEASKWLTYGQALLQVLFDDIAKNK